MQTTITEALAELKTLAKRIDGKRNFIGSHLVYHASMKDPLTKDGGAPEVLRREQQAISDLEARVVAIRAAIQRANLETPITVQDQTKTVSEWLAWRKDVLPGQKSFYAGLTQGINSRRREFTTKASAAPEDIVVNVDEKGLAEAIERINIIESTLDGQLSLKNATVTITV